MRVDDYMKPNGFGLLGLLSVMIILGAIVFLVVRHNKQVENTKEETDKVKELAAELSIKNYGLALESTITTYALLNYDVEDIIISVDGNRKDNCHIDATEGAREGATNCTGKSAKAVIYGGTVVHCQTATLTSNYEIKLTGCTAGTKTKYTYTTGSGVTKEVENGI
jgi:hypothetical protein